MPKRKRTPIENTADDLEVGPTRPLGKCRPGSIEQQLDMCEGGPLRGDEVEHSHGRRVRDRENRETMETLNDDLLQHNYRVDMSESGREGDEETGDEHSFGLQGEEQQEQQYAPEFGESDSGTPGEATEKNAHRDPTKQGYKRRGYPRGKAA